MIDNNTLIKVRNRDNGSVGYTIPDLGNLRRDFNIGEVKEIPMQELRKLSWIRGGKVLLEDFLLIENEEAVKELLGEVEPEYFYTEQNVEKLLKVGTVDQMLDCLEFAPQGVIEQVKKQAVDMEVNDINKRDAILEKTGFDVTSAIRINKESMEEDEVETKNTQSTRRSTPINNNTKPQKYNIVK